MENGKNGRRESIPFQRQSSRKFELVDRRRKVDNRQPFRTPTLPEPTSQLPCCSPAEKRIFTVHCLHKQSTLLLKCLISGKLWQPDVKCQKGAWEIIHGIEDTKELVNGY